jgi:fatty acid desaturase
MIVRSQGGQEAAVESEQRRADRLMSEVIEDAVRPLFHVNRRLGWLRLFVLVVPALACLWAYGHDPNLATALLWLVAGTLFYAFAMISTHDISHATLLDQGDLEQAVGCALSWPTFWPYLTYRNLHMVHHRMNGMDLRDPERREPTEAEAARASRLRQFHFRHPFWVSVLGMGGLQLILSMFWFGWKLRDLHSKLSAGLRIDLIGILLVQASLFTWAIHQGHVLRLVVALIAVERIVGGVMQARGMIEHHGLWSRNTTYELTQLYTSRNIEAGPVVNFLMGGLPHHSLHHAYPSIPYDKLPQATAIAEAELTRHGKPQLPKVSGYAQGLALLF